MDDKKPFTGTLGELSIIPDTNHQPWDLHPSSCGYVSPAELGPALARIWEIAKK